MKRNLITSLEVVCAFNAFVWTAAESDTNIPFFMALGSFIFAIILDKWRKNSTN